MAVKTMLKEWELIQENGEYIAGRKVFEVQIDSEGIDDNETILTTAFDDEDVPQSNDSWSEEFPRLVVVKRIPRFLGTSHQNRDKTYAVTITCEYLLEPATGIAYLGFMSEGAGFVQQIETSVDKTGYPVEYTYHGATKKAKFNVNYAQSSQLRYCIETTTDPEGMKLAYINRVNSDDWCGFGSGYWAITRVNFRPWDMSTNPPRWLFAYELSLSSTPDGWRYFGGPTDENGDIPSDAPIVECDWHWAIPFATKFPSGVL